MIKSFPLEYFIKIINLKIPQDTIVVDYISECISLGKDACYRRLRGEVEFSSTEIMKIASSLSISIDELIGISSKRSSVFETQFIYDKDVLKEYELLAKLRVNYLNDVANIEGTKLSFVSPALPFIMMSNEKILHQCRFYKWHYHHNQSNSKKLSDFQVTPKIYALLEQTFELLNDHELEFIFDSNLIFDSIYHLNFFYALGKITKDEIAEAKEEFLSFISRFEKYAETGVNHKGKPVSIYVSHVLLETSSILVDNDFRPQIFYSLYFANTIASRDPKTLNIHKSWLSFMKKSCSLITLTGEIERIRFFDSLRGALAELPQ